MDGKHRADTDRVEHNNAHTLSSAKPSTPTWLQTPVVMTALAMTISLQVLVVSQPIWLSGDGQRFTDRHRLAYVIGVSLIAVLLPALTIPHIGVLWKRASGKRSSIMDAKSNNELPEVPRYVVYSLYIACALLMSCINGSFEINVAERTYTSQAYKTSAPGLGSLDLCYRKQYDSPTDNHTLAWYMSQPDGNDSYLNAKQWRSSQDDGWSPCAIDYQRTLTTLRRVRGLGYGDGVMGTGGTREDDCHNALGGSVSCSAMGAPLAANYTCSVLNPFGCRADSSDNKACVPVFTSNPVSCQVKGSITGNRYRRQVDSITTDSCSVSTDDTRYALIRGSDGALTGFCPHDNALGDLSVVFGTYYPSIFGHLFNEDWWNEESVAIECNLSINETMKYRTIVNTTTLIETNHGTFTMPVLNSTKETCKPDSGSIEQMYDDEARLAAATLLYSFLNDPYLGTTGWRKAPLGLKSTQMGSDGGYPNPFLFGFKDSENAMEDFLGAMVASYMGYYYSGVISHGFQDATTRSYPSTYTSRAYRLGTGHSAALLYAAPTLVALIVVLSLSVIERRKNRRIILI